MKYGIYYAYWEKEWGGQFVPYVEKCKKLGFDVLEVACGAFHLENDQFFKDLRAAAQSFRANKTVHLFAFGGSSLVAPDNGLAKNVSVFICYNGIRIFKLCENV